MARRNKRRHGRRSYVGALLAKPAFVYPAYKFDLDKIEEDSEGTTFLYPQKDTPDGTSEFIPFFAPLSGKVINVRLINPVGEWESSINLLFSPTQWNMFNWGVDKQGLAENQRQDIDSLFSVTIASELPDGSVIFNEIYGLQFMNGRAHAKVGDVVTRGPSSVLGWRWLSNDADVDSTAMPIGWRTRFLLAGKGEGMSLSEMYKRAAPLAISNLASKMGGVFWINDATQNANLPPDEAGIPSATSTMLPSAPMKEKSNNTMLLVAAGVAAWFFLGKKGKKLF